MTSQQLGRLRPVPMRVQTDLHNGLRDGTPAIRNERVFQDPRKIALRRGLEPRRLPGLSTPESLDGILAKAAIDTDLYR